MRGLVLSNLLQFLFNPTKIMTWSLNIRRSSNENFNLTMGHNTQLLIYFTYLN